MQSRIMNSFFRSTFHPMHPSKPLVSCSRASALKSNSKVGNVNSNRPYSSVPSIQNKEFKKGILWFDNYYPNQHKALIDSKAYLLRQPSTRYIDKKMYLNLIPEMFPNNASFIATSAKQNLKESGLYLEFDYDGISIHEAIITIQLHLKTKPRSFIDRLVRVNAYEVKGTPWIEDLLSRIPSSKLHVEFLGPDLTVESLYREFRVFGRIHDISLQPSSSKDFPRYASIQFLYKKSATSARNCIHGEIYGQTKLQIGYEKTESNWEKGWHWINANLRLSIPAILILAAIFTYTVFDPWRVFSVTNKLTGRYTLSGYTQTASKWWILFTSLIEQTFFVPNDPGTDLVFEKSKSKTTHQWSEREVMENRLILNTSQMPQSITLVTGPKGSGKTQFINEVLHSKRCKLIIKCDDLVGKGDYQLLNNLSSQVNFFPTFGFLAQLGGLIDAMITATTGAKANIWTSHEGEIQKVLASVRIALEKTTAIQQNLRLEHYKIMSLEGVDEDEIKIVQEIEYPIIVIDNFLSKENVREQYIYDTLAQWAGQIAEYRIAHVIFVSDNFSAEQCLGKSLPTKSLDIFHLHDATPTAALSYVERRLGFDFDFNSIKLCIDGLGGRLNDLDLFISKIQAGMDPQDMIHRAIAEVRKIVLLDEMREQDWSPIQFWKVLSLLSKFKAIPFDDLVVHPLFNSNPRPLLQMQRAGLITCTLHNGRPFTVHAGRPLFYKAFEEMVADTKLDVYMKAMTASQLCKVYTEKINLLETELELLDRSCRKDRFIMQNEIEVRRRWVIETIGTFSSKAQSYFEEERQLKSQLKLLE